MKNDYTIFLLVNNDWNFWFFLSWNFISYLGELCLNMCARACMMGNIFMRRVCVCVCVCVCERQMECNRAPSEWWKKGRTPSMQMCICVRAGTKPQQMPTLITSQSANGHCGVGVGDEYMNVEGGRYSLKDEGMRRSIIAHIFPHLSFTRVKKTASYL